MSKKRNKIKRNKISKNRDIEELIEIIENSEKTEDPINNMEQVINKMDEEQINKERKFRESIKVENELVSNEAFEKRTKKAIDRLHAQENDYNKKNQLLKTIAKLEKKPTKEEIENEKEIQQFFSDAKEKTDICEREQDKNVKNNRLKNISEETLNSMKTRKTTKKAPKSENKKSKTLRVAGTSMEEIFSSKKFEEIWKQSQDNEER